MNQPSIIISNYMLKNAEELLCGSARRSTFSKKKLGPISMIFGMKSLQNFDIFTPFASFWKETCTFFHLYNSILEIYHLCQIASFIRFQNLVICSASEKAHYARTMNIPHRVANANTCSKLSWRIFLRNPLNSTISRVFRQPIETTEIILRPYRPGSAVREVSEKWKMNSVRPIWGSIFAVLDCWARWMAFLRHFSLLCEHKAVPVMEPYPMNTTKTTGCRENDHKGYVV